MDKRYHLMSEAALAALLVSHLPFEQIPELMSTRVRQRVLATVNELRRTTLTEPVGQQLVADRVARRQVLLRS